jgi:hypothetical protein
MNKRIESLNTQLQSLGLQIVSDGGRRKNGVTQKFFYVQSIRTYGWMGDDGEMNYSHFFAERIVVGSITELNMAKIEETVLAERGKTLAQIASEVAEKVAKEDAEIAERRKVVEAERAQEKAELEEALKPADREVFSARLEQMGVRAVMNDESKIDWFTKVECKRTLVSDDYREDFLNLIQNEQVVNMAIDLIGRQSPDLLASGYEGMMRINHEAHRRGVVGRSLGAVQSAIKYLVGATK